MNKRFNATAQGGFTLIELIVVIVILGILAATALPKFASLGGDARVASLQAAKGSLSSVVAMAHGKSLLNSAVTFEGTTVNMSNGYPKADATLLAAAGLSSTTDYTPVNAGNTGNTTSPTTTATQIALVPTALSGKTQAASCYVIYTEATVSNGVTTPPTVALGPNATADNCQ